MSILNPTASPANLLNRFSRECQLNNTADWLSNRLLRCMLVVGWAAIIPLCLFPELPARKLVGAILPGTDDTAFTIRLMRSLAVAGLLSLVGLTLIHTWSRPIRYRTLGGWVLFSSMAFGVCLAASFGWYVDDDAAISFAYSRNLADGLGLVRAPGEPAVEGYSNPLWVILLAAMRWGGADIIVSAKLLAVGCAIGTLLAMWQLVRDEHPLCWLALPLAMSNAALVIWSHSGLENALHMLLVTSGAVALVEQKKGSRHRGSLICVLMLLVLSRPEGILFTLAAAALVRWWRYRHGQSIRGVGWILVAPLVVLVVLTAFRYVYFGDLLPNTYYAKGTGSHFLRLLNPFSGGWIYVFSAAQAAGWPMALIPLLLMMVNHQTWTPVISAAMAMIAAQLVFVVSVGGDWMLEYRFITAIVPLVSIVVVIAWVRLLELIRANLPIFPHSSLIAPAVLLGVPVAVMMAIQIPRLMVFAHQPTTPMDTVARIAWHFEELGKRAGLERATLLAHDAGGTSYCSNLRLIDLGGLCDRTIAKQQHDREAIGDYIFHQCRPDFIYSAKVFADRFDLERFPEFQSQYRPLPPPVDPLLQGYLRHVRADLYPKLFPSAHLDRKKTP